jgi:4-amino-4-deoxy-L-arabinose transferase-like glycosyltransferase
MKDETVTTPAPVKGRWKRWQIITAIVLLAAILRTWAAWQLPIDADEPTYLRAGQAYAQDIKTDNLQGLLNYADNREHPILVKLLYSLPYLFIQPEFESNTELWIDRGISVFFGTLAVLVLALIEPWAGFFLAFDSMTIKYTSEVYLEAMPLFATILAVYALQRGLAKPGFNRWIWISALALGAAASGKYLYGLAAVPLLGMFIWRKRASWQSLLGFALVALAAFWLLDPYLWVNPGGRLLDSLFFHFNYTQGSDVLRANYPWYQALNWITMTVPWHPSVFFFPTLDVVITALAVAGVWSELKKRPWAVVWAVFVLLVLLAWPTKWPQYTLLLKPALCLVGATGLIFLVERARDYESTWHWAETVLPRPNRLFWSALIAFCALLTFGKVSTEIRLAIVRAGWLTVQAEYSPLPSNSVFSLAALKDGSMAIGSEGGLSIWKANAQAPWGESPLTLTTTNSGLPGNRVTAILAAYEPVLWLGTNAGLVKYGGGEDWKTYSFAQMGLAARQINALAANSDGTIWVATDAGVAVLNPGEETWKTITTQNSGLANDNVFSMAIDPGKAAWFGTLKGLNRLDLVSGEWQSNELGPFILSFGGVTNLYLDSQDKLWVCNPGSGLLVWDGETWQNYRTSNSKIPQNNVNMILETAPDVYWAGFAFSMQPGGQLARFDGSQWQVFTPNDSGFAGDEPAALAFDTSQRLWVATKVNGLQIFATTHK